MSIKIGDKIRFLNDIGGGVVTGFKSPIEVIVEQEDGFEFPHLVSECVVIESGTPQPTTTQNSGGEVVQTKSINHEDKGHIYLAFAPTNINLIEQSNVAIYLVNNEQKNLHFTLSSSQNGSDYKCRKSGVIAPNQRLLLEEVARVNLPQIENLHVQMIAFQNIGLYKMEQPIDRSINLKLTKFSRPNCFSFNSSLGCEVMAIELSNRTECKTNDTEINLDNLREALNKKRVDNSQKKISAQPTPQLIEVDLHIDKLIDSTAGMTSGDILKYQIDHFHEVMQLNERYRGVKIVFIHGKGEGVLRNALLKEIKKMGREKKCQEASFKKYGFGALMVTI